MRRAGPGARTTLKAPRQGMLPKCNIRSGSRQDFRGFARSGLLYEFRYRKTKFRQTARRKKKVGEAWLRRRGSPMFPVPFFVPVSQRHVRRPRRCLVPMDGIQLPANTAVPELNISSQIRLTPRQKKNASAVFARSVVSNRVWEINGPGTAEWAGQVPPGRAGAAGSLWRREHSPGS